MIFYLNFFQTFPTYENGVWAQDIIPQNANGGKRHIFKGHVEGDVLIVVTLKITYLYLIYLIIDSIIQKYTLINNKSKLKSSDQELL